MVFRRARVWHVGKEFFDSQLKPIFNVGLIDPIYSIRQACIAIIKDMSDIFGPDWTVAHLVRISPYWPTLFLIPKPAEIHCVLL
jgi:hypothetical protein